MEKIKISVVGSCESRNIFNAPHMRDIFDCRCFAFQVVPWGCFECGLNIPEEVINNINGLTLFEKRVLEYNLNKKTLSFLEKEKVDFLVVDLLACSFVMYKVFLEDKMIMGRMGHGDRVLDIIAKQPYLANRKFKYEKFDYRDLDYDYVLKGLSRFADWINQHYSGENVIFCYPAFPKHWIDKDLKVRSYAEDTINKYNKDKEYIDALTDYLVERVPKCKVYYFPENMCAEEYGFKAGLPFHQTNLDYIRQADKMLDLLQLDYHKWYSLDLEPVSYLMEQWVKKYYDARKMIFDLERGLIKDSILQDKFEGTSVSSVSTQLFGHGLLRVKNVLDMVEKQKEEAEMIWYHKYIKLRKDYVELFRLVTGERLLDIVEGREDLYTREYNYGLIPGKIENMKNDF